MSFKRALVGVFTAAFLLLTACGLQIGEKAAKPGQIAYGGSGYNCVGEIPKHIQAYVANQLSEDQINQFMFCLQKSFRSFGQLTRGSQRDTYAPTELRNFIQTYFLKTHTISDGFLNEFMVLKQTLFGGSVDRLSRGELFAAIDFIEKMRIEAVRLKPFLPLLNPDLMNHDDIADLPTKMNVAYSALNQTIQTLGAQLNRGSSPYTLDHLENFLAEFRAFIEWEKHVTDTHSTKEWCDFLRAFKEIANPGPVTGEIAPGEWVPFGQALAHWYLSFLHYQVGVKGQNVLVGVGLRNLIALISQVFIQLEDAINLQSSKTIRFEKIDAMLAAVMPMKWLPDNLRLVSLQEASRKLITRIFGDEEIAPSERHSQGLTVQVMANLRSDFYRWSGIQTDIDQQYGPEHKIDPVVDVLPQLSSIPIDARMQLINLQGDTWDEFYKVTSIMKRPLYSVEGNRVWIIPQRDLLHYQVVQGFANLSRMNLLRSVVGMIFRGYVESGDTSSLWTSGIDQSEWVQFFVDFRDLTIDVGLVDGRTKPQDAGYNTFIEGNLFTFDSDGVFPDAADIKGKLNSVEAMELFAFLYSGGNLASSIHERLRALCPIEGPLDLTKRPKIQRKCVIFHLADVLMAESKTMPGLQTYLAGLSTPQRILYSLTLLETAYADKYSDPAWVESSEISTISVISQYAEAVMARYDADADGRLSNEDLKPAIDNFSGFIKIIAAKGKDPKNLSYGDSGAVLTYILANKKLPETFFDQTFAIGSEYWGEPTLDLDRGDMSLVFKVIGQKLMNPPDTSTTPTQAPPPPLLPMGIIDPAYMGYLLPEN